MPSQNQIKMTAPQSAGWKWKCWENSNILIF